jgi:hypothetical protein
MVLGLVGLAVLVAVVAAGCWYIATNVSLKNSKEENRE